jgi:hypothetical protein
MKLVSAFSRSILPSICGLLIGCYAASVILILADSIGDRDFLKKLLDAPSGALMYSIYALIFFAVPAMLVIGWPVYAYVLHKGRASYVTSAYVPMILSLLSVVSVSVKFAVVVAVYALLVAWTAHWLQLRANSSFKGNPLRGSA